MTGAEPRALERHGARSCRFHDVLSASNLIGGDGKPLFPRPMEQQFDSLLYLAPRSAITQLQLSPSLCADSGYMKMRLGRIMLLAMKPDIDRLLAQCGTTAQ